MKRLYYLFIFLFVVAYGVSFALTPEEILLLKRSGVSDEKILEMQKKEGGVTPQAAPAPPPPINAFDWNEDGKKDIIAGSDSGEVYVYLNSGTNSKPVFDKPVEISGVKVARYSDPYIGDWNSDGKKDIIVGQDSGEVYVFVNMGTNKAPLFGSRIKLNGGDLDVGKYSSVTMVDWNGDNKKDMLVGNWMGNTALFLNTGTASSPRFPDEGMETQISVSNYATPFAADLNGDGKFDVVSGASNGRIYIFINNGDDKNPRFGEPQILRVNNKKLRLAGNTSVIAVDWDDDGKMDLLVSSKGITETDAFTGRKEVVGTGVHLLLNTGTKEKPEFKELKTLKGMFKGDMVL